MYQSNLHQQATELYSVWEELLIVANILLDLCEERQIAFIL